MSNFSTISCNIQSPIYANTANNILNNNSGTPQVLPAGAIIRNVFLHVLTALTPGATLRIGTTDDHDFLISSSLGITSDSINGYDLMYATSGIKWSTGVDENLVLNPDIDIDNGYLKIYIEYNLGNELF